MDDDVALLVCLRWTLFADQMKLKPMDGNFEQSPTYGWIQQRRIRRLCVGIGVLVTCAGLVCFDSLGVAADRPGLFRRPFSRSQAKQSTTAVLPPSPESDDDSDVDVKSKSRTIKPVKAQTSSPALRGLITDSTGMQRFPVKSEKSLLPTDALPPEFAVGLDERSTSIDLPAALQLAGWNSPEVLLAQQKVLAMTARQQLAAAQALPSLNVGMNFDSHTGALQRASGAIFQVQRSALYVGGGANAVAAGTVNLPGLTYNMNVGEAYFGYLVSRQISERQRAAADATRNQTLLAVADAYCQLVREQGVRAIAVKIRDDAVNVERITSDYAKVGQGRPADAERAATEVGVRQAEILNADAAIIEASAQLGRILNLESSVRLQSSESWVVPRPIVPDLIPLPELIAIALYQRPEVAERRAEVHAAMLELDGAKLLIFSPQFIAGFSDGAFGGGSDFVAATGSPRFGEFANRTDADLIMYWSIRNLGLANKALINAATARLAAANWEQTRKLNQVRAEVAEAYARTQSRSAELDVRVRAVQTSTNGFREDLTRAKAGEGRPIEVLDSLRLLARSQLEYLDTITAYNKAHYELYVAIGQPPAELLIHADPPDGSTEKVQEEMP